MFTITRHGEHTGTTTTDEEEADGIYPIRPMKMPSFPSLSSSSVVDKFPNRPLPRSGSHELDRREWIAVRKGRDAKAENILSRAGNTIVETASVVYLLRMRASNGIAEPQMEVDTQLDSLWEVILYNDDHNDAAYVIICLMKIFRHNRELAIKIMQEAHQRGSAVAEVEEREAAQRHRKQLQECGLTAAVRAV